MLEKKVEQEDLVNLSDAFLFAIEAHSGSFRGDGIPYVSHPFRVAFHAMMQGLEMDAIIAAVLHDVVEDTEIPLSTIEEKFGTKVMILVDVLSKPPQGTPNRSEIYKKKLLSGPEDARKIKLLDIHDNLSDVDDFMDAKDALRYKKNREALAEILRASL